MGETDPARENQAGVQLQLSFQPKGGQKEEPSSERKHWLEKKNGGKGLAARTQS